MPRRHRPHRDLGHDPAQRAPHHGARDHPAAEAESGSRHWRASESMGLRAPGCVRDGVGSELQLAGAVQLGELPIEGADGQVPCLSRCL